jgi:hypothetical protein
VIEQIWFIYLSNIKEKVGLEIKKSEK